MRVKETLGAEWEPNYDGKLMMGEKEVFVKQGNDFNICSD